MKILLQRVAAEIEADGNGAAVLLINSRVDDLTTGKRISQALCKQVVLQGLLPKFYSLRKLVFETDYGGRLTKVEGLPERPTLAHLFKLFQKDTEDLDLTIKKLHLLVRVLERQGLHAVIVIGTI